MKILLLGKNGQLGWELQRSLAVAGEVVALGHEDGGDFTQPDALLARVQAVAPQVIVNAAAYTAVDKAESEAEAARQVNARTPALLAIEAKRTGALLVHYSMSTAAPRPRAKTPSAPVAASTSSCAPAGSTRPAAATSPRPCCAWRRSASSSR